MITCSRHWLQAGWDWCRITQVLLQVPNLLPDRRQWLSKKHVGELPVLPLSKRLGGLAHVSATRLFLLLLLRHFPSPSLSFPPPLPFEIASRVDLGMSCIPGHPNVWSMRLTHWHVVQAPTSVVQAFCRSCALAEQSRSKCDISRMEEETHGRQVKLRPVGPI